MKKKILYIVVILFMLTSLTGCITSSYELPLNGFKDETNLYGWLLVWPIGWLMSTIGSFFNNSFAIALIITTIIVRVVAWPIYMGATNTSYKMQLAQPDMQRVQAKYAGRSDQHSKQKMSQEMSAVYKKHNVNPLGCVTIFFQLPLFTAMYAVVRRITVVGGELTLDNYKFLFFDLAIIEDGERIATNILYGGIANQIFCGILTAIVVTTMILQQKVTSKKPSYQKNIPTQQVSQMQNQMKMMMYMMPIMMGFIASQDSGMALYWVVGNTFSLLQAIFVKRRQEKNYIKNNSLTMITPDDLKESKRK